MALYSLANQAGAAFRSALNTVLGKIHSNYAGTTDPVSASENAAGMLWVDTNTTPPTLKIRNAANSAWVSVGGVDTSFLLAGTTAFSRTILDDTTAAQARTTLGLGAAATSDKIAGLEFISSQDASASATLDFTGFDAAKYDAYEFVLSDIRASIGGAVLYLRTSSDGGSSYDATSGDYSYGQVQRTHDPADSLASAASLSNVAVWLTSVVGSGAGEGVHGRVRINSPHLATPTRVTFEMAGYIASFEEASITGSGLRKSSAAVDAVRFLFASGNIASGTITMYGLRNS